MSDALRLHRLRTKALEIDTDIESDCEVDNGLSTYDEWENLIITLSDDSDDDDEDVDLLHDDAEAEASIFARVALYHTSTYILTYCIDASVSAGFFFVSEHPKRGKTGGLGVNKRNRGIQRLLNSSSALLGNFRKFHFFCLEQKLTPLLQRHQRGDRPHHRHHCHQKA